MRWIILIIIALTCFIGIQSSRAEGTGAETRSETRFLRVSCSSAGGVHSSLFLPGLRTLDEAERKAPERMRKIRELCERKAQRALASVGGSSSIAPNSLRWEAELHVTGMALGSLNDACAIDRDCESQYACHELTGRCAPSITLSNLPLAP